MECLVRKIRAADAFIFVVSEYNWGRPPGLKNFTDHFLEEWFLQPAAVVSYSPRRLFGARAASALYPILSEMGIVVISSTVAVGPITETLDAEGSPIGTVGELAQKALRRMADDLAWSTSAAHNQRLPKLLPH